MAGPFRDSRWGHGPRRPARRRPRTAFVLSGGANLGAIQVGQLRALLEVGIVPDLIVGCSVGALNAVAIASNPTLEGVDRLEEIWEGITAEHIFPGGRMTRLWHLACRHSYLHRGNALRSTIDAAVGITDLSETKVPVEVVTVELATGKPRWWSTGPAVDVLCATAALPGILPPVMLDGRRHIDGGVTHNVPLARAGELGARNIIVLDVLNRLTPRPVPSTVIEIALEAWGISRRALVDHDVASIARGTTLTMLPAPDVGRVSPFDFTRTRELIDAGYHLTRTYLEEDGALRAGPRRRISHPFRRRNDGPAPAPAAAPAAL